MNRMLQNQPSNLSWGGLSIVFKAKDGGLREDSLGGG